MLSTCMYKYSSTFRQVYISTTRQIKLEIGVDNSTHLWTNVHALTDCKIISYFFVVEIKR